MTLSLADVRRLLNDAGIDPKKSLGQNFVIDPNTVRRIARLSRVGPESRVVEIGAGLGSLTLALIETGARVTAIETDKALIPILTDLVGDHAEIIEADVRNLKWDETLPNPGWNLVANLPYNIATSIVLTVLDEVPSIDRMLQSATPRMGQSQFVLHSEPTLPWSVRYLPRSSTRDLELLLRWWQSSASITALNQK